MNNILQKIANEVLYGSGNTNTPEPEELLGLQEIQPTVLPNGTLHSIKAHRQRPTGNRTFHKYAGDLWSIKAARLGICMVCQAVIHPGEEITMFTGTPGWAHMTHAIDQPSPNRRLDQ